MPPACCSQARPHWGRPLEFVFKSLLMPTKYPRLTAGDSQKEGFSTHERNMPPACCSQARPHWGRPLEFVFKSLQMPTKYPRLTAGVFCWRRRRDLNPRGAFYTPYSLSRGAPSATWVLLHIAGWYQIGGESGIRTHGCFHIAGFQDRCFRPLSHLSGYKSGGATPSIAEHSVP